MNLKERLTSTENLLRSIRSGEAFASLRKTKEAKRKADQAAGPRPAPQPFTQPRADGSDAPEAKAPPPAPPKPAPSASPARKPFWTRQLTFGAVGKAAMLGVSMSAGRLSLALVSGGALQFTARFPFGPDQAFGQKGFPAFLRTCLESVRDQASQAKVWAVLRTQDLDLNVLTVPKLSGAKLDAAVYWTQQKEKKFAEAEYILDYVVLGPTRDAPEPRLDVLTCLARRVDVDRLRDAFRDAGWPLDGITATPSALQNLYRLPGAPKGFSLAANIHLEADYSVIGLYREGDLRFSRFIRSGSDGMTEALVEHFQALAKPKPVVGGDLELPPLGAPPGAQPGAKPPPKVLQPLDSVQARGLLLHVLLGRPAPPGLAPGHLIGEARLLEAIAPAIDRLAKQVERTLEYYATSQGQRCDVVHFSGSLFSSRGLLDALAGQLGYPHAAFEASSMLPGKAGNVATGDRTALAPALGASLSATDKGINLLRNYKQRAATVARQAVTRGLIFGLAAFLVLVGLAGLALERGNAAKRQELAQAQARLQASGPSVDEATLTAAVAQFKTRQEFLRAAAGRFTAPAVLAELARRAPANVKILSLTLDMGVAPAASAAPGKPPAAQPTAQPADLMTLEGIVLGNKADFEPTLSRFIIELQASPMFQLPVVHQTGLKDLGSEGQVLHFVLHMGVV